MTTKRTLLTSVVSLVLCFCMLLGTTFAWFTDVVTSGGNIIASGNLDAQMHWSDKLLAADSDEWQDADGNPVFNYNNWEPGYTEVRYVKISNAGSLNFRWKLTIEADGEVTDLSDVIDVYYVNPVTNELTKDGIKSLTSVGTLTDVLENNTALDGRQLTPGSSVILAIAFHMDELAGNDYQNKSLCDAGFSLKLIATQDIGESDSFGDDYDKDATFPPLNPDAIGTVAIPDGAVDGNGILTVDLEINSTTNDMNAIIPAGVKVADGATELTLTAGGTTRSSNINMNYGQLSRSLDVHIDGVAEDNTVPMEIYLGTVLPVGYYNENVAFYHVEDDVAYAMDLVDSFDAHNQFTYNSETGEVTINIASFSEVTAVINEGNIWQGARDYDWYTKNPDATEFYISNSNELAGFGAIVGGMAKDENDAYIVNIVDAEGNTIHRDSFAKKTVYLTEDICIGDLTDEDGRDVVFYPIGYYNNEETYTKSNKAISSYFNNFEGTFDGQGHTISDWYQNTWEMKGDHTWYSLEEQRYRDGMGLFGKVYGGTVKNLVVKNFSSDGEITTTGTIAAYADCGATFENIEIYNCNPRVYNIGNGGIVGCVGWYAEEADKQVYFTNITVDDTNKISALWGSWDVSCGGIVGQYYAYSGQTEDPNGGIVMTNCDVAAVIDVNNDVCGNYQYYQYRYAGMLIGTVGRNSDPSEDAKKIEFNNCRVRYGDWAEYYYCELVENTQASYTHDHQMSRLTKIYNLNEIKSGDNWLKTGDFVLIEGETKTCYHIRKDANGFYQHSHSDYNRDGVDDYQVVDGESVLVEDKQVVHITFKQLYTGYGWGATPMHGDTTIVEYLYSIKYINNGKVLYTDYVKDNSKDYSTNSKDEAKAAASKAESEMNDRDDGKTYKFAYWMNAGSTKIESVKAGNRENIVLYPSFEGVYTAMFVDQQGNVIGWDTFTKGNGSNITDMGNSIVPPTIDGFQFSYWEVHITDDKGKTNNKGKLSDYKFQDETDISIYPIYIYKGEAALKPVDIDGDGDTDYYEVTGFTDGKGVEVVEIPNIVNGKPVTTINTNAFSSYDDLYSVRIPANITSINYQSFSADNPDKWGENRDTVTLYYEGNPDKWKQYMDVFYKSNNKYNDYNYDGTAPTYPQDATTIFQGGWDNMMGDGSRVFFIGENGIVDTSLGYWELYVEGKNFLGQGGTYTWIYHKHEYDHNNKCSKGHKVSGEVENYLEKKDNKYTRPDYTYWTTERNPEDQ